MHYSIDTFRSKDGRETNSKSKTEPKERSGDNAGDSKDGSKGSQGASKSQDDTRAYAS